MQPSRGFVLLSFLGNTLLVLLKAFAWGITGSAGMLAQTQHAVGNVTVHLLLLADSSEETSVREYSRTPSSQYFLAFVVTAVILGILAVATIRHGQNFLGTPYREVNVTFNYVVLGGALVFQTGLLVQTIRRLSMAEISPRRLLSGGFEDSREASAGTTLLEQVLAIIGLVIAFLGILLTDLTGNATFDAMATILIGFVMLSLLALLTRGSQPFILGGRE